MNYRKEGKSNLSIFSDFTEFLEEASNEYSIVKEEGIRKVYVKILAGYIESKGGVKNTNFLELSNVESEEEISREDFLLLSVEEQINKISEYIGFYDLIEDVLEETDVKEIEKIKLVDDFIKEAKGLFKN